MLLLMQIVGLALMAVSINSQGDGFGGTQQSGEGSRRHCPTTFGAIWSLYRSCQGGSISFWRHNITERETLVGEDIVDFFNNACPDIMSSSQCVMQAVTGCQEDTVEVIEQALARSTWICHEGQMRNSVATLLTSSSAPEQESYVGFCSGGTENARPCVAEIIERINLPNEMRNGINLMSVEDVFANPLSTRYFYGLFDCAISKVAQRCPQNTLPMAMSAENHLFFPPKFGINVSDILLTSGQDGVWD